MSQFGDVRDWQSAEGSPRSPTSARLEPREDGTVLTIVRSTRAHTMAGWGMAFSWTFFAALLSAFLLWGDFQPGVWAIPAILGALAPISLAAGRVLGRRFEEQSRVLLETVADKVELIGRTERG